MANIDIIPGARISSSALDAERARMEIVSNNLANVNSTGKDGKVYQKRIPVFEAVYNEASGAKGASELGGVRLTSVDKGEQAPVKIYSPYHPHADKDGMVSVPNMSPMEEMMDMITASRAYEANLSALRQAREMADKTITLGRS